MSEFKREERFIVIKRKNLRPIDERELHAWLQQNEIQTCECVVVESDWPEYEQVWSMIEARVTGAQSILAAKDARIAGLERELDARMDALKLALGTIGELKAIGASKPEVEAARPYLDCLRDSVGAIYGDGANTPSEDGREVPEVVGHLLLGGVFDANEYEDNDIQLDMKIVERLQSELVLDIDAVPLALMTIAQHSRIVAAKDADIARLNDAVERYAADAIRWTNEANALRAQPARQVGDIQLSGEYHADVNMLLEHISAALAPAAVVEVDIVETLIQAIDKEQDRLSAEDDYLMDSDDCIEVIRETVARLNRNPIPLDLLKRVAKPGYTELAKRKLRALLGKDGLSEAVQDAQAQGAEDDALRGKP